MQTYKPMMLGLTTRPIEFRRRLGLSISAGLFFPLRPAGEGTLWTEMSMWKFLEAEMPEGPFIDECIVKQRNEFLVRGSAYAPANAGGRVPAIEVSATVAGIQKKLHVFGPRRWQGRHAGEPEPFASVPLDWQHAYGGADFPANPLGLGRAKDSDEHWLPQVLLPNTHPTGPDDEVPPAGLRPLDCMWPQRARYAGTYDQRWLEEQSPGFASDMDWRYFNLAPEDQWLPELRGDESFEFVNMHPERQVLQGVLPGFAPRVFVDRGDGQTARLREVELKLTTLWFFPHAERGIALFQGLAKCEEDDATDIKTLLGAVERLGQPRAIEHYLDALNQRRDPEVGTIVAMRESDLLPDGFVSEDPAMEAVVSDFKLEGLQAEAARRGAQFEIGHAMRTAKASGVDPAKLALVMPDREPVPALEALPEYLLKKRAEALNAQVTALLDAAEQLNAAKARMAAAGIDPESLVHRGPPTFRASTQIEALARVGTPADQVKAAAPKLLKLEGLQRIGYLQGAHAQPPAKPLPPQRAKALRDSVQEGHAQKKSFLGADLTGADLSGMDLSGADFSGAWLESANLSRTKLHGTVFMNAVLAHADLSEADATGADFSGANLGKAKLTNTRLVQATLAGTLLMDTPLAHTDLRGARLDDAKLLGATFGLADWRSVQASGLIFRKASLKDMVFHRCRLSQPTFVECDLAGADFAVAELIRPTFVKCTGIGARFTHASLEGAVFVDGCDFSRADFSDARLKACNLRGAMLAGARFDRALLDEADLGEADCSAAQFNSASLRSAILIKTHLQGAVMARANLMNAIVQRADLRGTDLRAANLYGTDLSRIWTNTDTQLAGASFDRAKIFPRRDHPPPAA